MSELKKYIPLAVILASLATSGCNTPAVNEELVNDPISPPVEPTPESTTPDFDFAESLNPRERDSYEKALEIMGDSSSFVVENLLDNGYMEFEEGHILSPKEIDVIIGNMNLLIAYTQPLINESELGAMSFKYGFAELLRNIDPEDKEAINNASAYYMASGYLVRLLEAHWDEFNWDQDTYNYSPDMGYSTENPGIITEETKKSVLKAFFTTVTVNTQCALDNPLFSQGFYMNREGQPIEFIEVYPEETMRALQDLLEKYNYLEEYSGPRFEA